VVGIKTVSTIIGSVSRRFDSVVGLQTFAGVDVGDWTVGCFISAVSVDTGTTPVCTVDPSSILSSDHWHLQDGSYSLAIASHNKSTVGSSRSSVVMGTFSNCSSAMRSVIGRVLSVTRGSSNGVADAIALIKI
jgi:hypothetical protein